MNISMDTPVAAPANVDSEFESLHPNARWGIRLSAGLVLALLALGLSIALAVLLEQGFDVSRVWAFALLPLWLGLAAWLGWRYAEARFQSTRLRLDPLGIELQRGVWWRSETRVPRARVQHTDIHHGPLDRRLGTATLVIHTAGSEVAALRIAGLAEVRALELRDDLLSSSRDEL